MKRFAAVLLFFTMLFGVPVSLFAGEIIHHDLKVQLNPKTHFIEVEDKIDLPARLFNNDNKLTFILHGNLQPTS